MHKTATARTNRSSHPVLEGEGSQKWFASPQAASWAFLQGTLFAFAPPVHTLLHFWEVATNICIPDRVIHASEDDEVHTFQWQQPFR